jgi:hypothetical protein
MFLVVVVCCLAEVSATSRSLVEWSHTDCGGYCVWSRNLKNGAALARVGLLRQREEKSSLHCPKLRLLFGALEKFRKATISFTISVHQSAWNSSVPIEMIFIKSAI